MEMTSNVTDVVGRLPKPTDEDEQRIVELIRRELLATDEAKETFETARQRLIHYFNYCLANVDDAHLIHAETQRVLSELSSFFHTKIVSGQDNLDRLSKRSPVIAVVNHLGSYKLTEITPAELGLNLPIDIVHPFPIYYAPLVPIGTILEDNLYEAHVELPQPLYKIQQAAGLVIVPPDKEGKLAKIEERTAAVITLHNNALITVFPEGGTSGKRNQGGPYDLEKFHKGAFIIAARLGIPVLPVCQYYNPMSGFEIAVMPPIRPQTTQTENYFEQLALNTQAEMQNWLNSKK